VERIKTVVSAGNLASLAMLQRLGEAEVGEPESGVQRVVVELDRPTPQSSETATHPVS
jgi:hypothetical protein